MDAVASTPIIESTYPEEYEEDYMSLIIDAIKNRDFESAEQYTTTRNKKIIELGLEDEYQVFEWDDAFGLMCTIYQEGGGGSKITDDELLCYANVVLNRVNHKEFPDSITDVLTQEGQYKGFEDGVYLIDRTDNQLEIDAIERSFNIGLRALNGELGKNDKGEYCPDTIIWQSNSKQGKGVWWRTASGTWFCY